MDIINAIVSGATTVDEVVTQTCAATGAGCCVQSAERLIDYLCVPEPRKKARQEKNENQQSNRCREQLLVWVRLN